MPHRLPRATRAALICVSLLAVAAGRAAAERPAAPTTAPAAGAREAVQAPANLPDGARVTGDLAGATPLQVTVALTPRDPAALDAFVAAVATPGSPDFRHYLSVAQFAQRFGADGGDVAAVRSALAAAGLTAGALSADGLSLPVSGTADELESAFHTTLSQVRLAGGDDAYADTTAPSLPAAAAAGVSAVVGLDSLPLAGPQGLRRVADPQRAAEPRLAGVSGGPQTCPSAVGRGTTAPQIGAAYGMDGLWSAGDLGAGQTIALYELEPFSATDVAAYQSCYGTSATVQVKTIGAGPGTGYGSGEAALDVEDVAGLAPRATIVVYQAKNGTSAAFGAYQQIVTDDTARVISTSWGLCESRAGSATINAEATLFAEAASQGQTLLAASGDDGADDCRTGSGQAVDDPASQPNVTAVGGTTLSDYLRPDLETVWNHGAPRTGGAGGGGLSAVNARPGYQPAALGARRAVPDVSADADPSTGYPIYFKGGWATYGGTSAAAPTWAALLALADGSSYCGAPVGFVNPVLYALPESDFYDVTSGNNTFNGVAGFTAGSGYDMASGLGAPDGASLVPALCGAQQGTTVPPPASSTTTTTTTTPAPIVPAPAPSTTQPAPTPTTTTATTTTTGTTTSGTTTTTTRSPGGSAVVFRAPARMHARVGRAVAVTLHASSRTGRTLRFSAIGLPAGLRIARGSGTVRGIPRRAGRFTTTVRAADTAGNAVSVVIRWRVSRH